MPHECRPIVARPESDCHEFFHQTDRMAAACHQLVRLLPHAAKRSCPRSERPVPQPCRKASRRLVRGVRSDVLRVVREPIIDGAAFRE